MAATIIMFLVIFFLPRLLVIVVNRVPFLKNLGRVFLCYVTGLILSFVFKAAGADISLAADFSSVLVCVAMPLILFSADLPSLKKLAKPMLASYGMNTVSVIAVAIAAFFIFKNILPDVQNISGMLIGTYTGGTPNMFAIGNGLSASPEQILLLQTSDMIGGGVYFLLLISLVPRLFQRILPAYQSVGKYNGEEATAHYTKKFSSEKQNVKPLKSFLSRIGLVGLALLCFLAAMGICLLLPSRFGNTGLAKLSEFTALIMLIVTSGGILLSFIKKVRNAPGSYSAGQYFILMFSVVMGLSFDLSAVSGALLMQIMLLLIQFSTVLIHLLMARLAGIDYHTMIITSTAGVFGPAFIIPVAKALKNDEIILPGILCGILGYAIGNYLGIAIGSLLRIFI